MKRQSPRRIRCFRLAPSGCMWALRAALLVIPVAASGSPNEPPAGFSALFNGRNLDGWRGGETFDHRTLMAMTEAERAAKIELWSEALTEVNEETGKPHWRVEDGVLISDGFGAYATTKRDYGDFELLVDFRMTPDGDSGVYLRGIPQVQIWDPNAADPNGVGKAKGSGGLWNNTEGAPGRDPLVKADRPPGEWNHFRILMIGDRVSVWLNGHYVVDFAELENFFDRKLPSAQRRSIPGRGPIQLQTHGSEMRWRNLFIREIGHHEATQIRDRYLGNTGPNVPAPSRANEAIVNGTEPGWNVLGEEDFAEVNCGSDTWTWRGDELFCSGEPIGVIRTRKTYTNFELIAEWRHMRFGGNSGIFLWATDEALRGLEPGELPRGGIETQILDDGYHALHEARTGRRGTFFTTQGDVFAVGTSSMNPFPPRSPNGSRSFPRLERTLGVGEWNHYYIRAINGEVRLWVNGVEVSGGSDCRPSEGYLCLESEGAPVEFRNLRIRELR